jgi:hypothetical protein
VAKGLGGGRRKDHEDLMWRGVGGAQREEGKSVAGGLTDEGSAGGGEKGLAKTAIGDSGG